MKNSKHLVKKKCLFQTLALFLYTKGLKCTNLKAPNAYCALRLGAILLAANGERATAKVPLLMQKKIATSRTATFGTLQFQRVE